MARTAVSAATWNCRRTSKHLMVDNEGARYDLLPLTIGNNTMQKLFSAALVTCTIFTGSSFGPAALVASTIVAGISFVPEPANAAVGVTRTTRHLNIRAVLVPSIGGLRRSRPDGSSTSRAARGIGVQSHFVAIVATSTLAI